MYSFKNPKSYIENNVHGTINLMHIAHKNSIKKFYFTSSSSVYGNKKKFPIKETSSLKPLNTYAKTKKKCEKILKDYFKKTDVDLKIFRPFTVYGTYARPDMIFITYLKKTSKDQEFFFTIMEIISEILHMLRIYVKFLQDLLKLTKLMITSLIFYSSRPIKIKKILPIIDFL